jgi:signal recognition particle subunit SRP54
MLETLSGRLQGVFNKLGSRGAITEKDLDEALREVRVALLEADVNFKVVREFIQHVRERALGAEVMKSLSGPQQVIAIVNEELIHILGDQQADLQQAAKPPTILLLLGLKGSGKTTTAAKLALHLRKRGQKPLLVAADPYRVAGGEQLQALGKQLNVPVYRGDGVKPAELADAALAEAQRVGASALIVDTPGRAGIDDEQSAEVEELQQRLSPTEVLLVVDAMTGQEAVNVAQEFQQAFNVSGFIMTKVDGDARGGAALSLRAVTGLPIKFIGVGEKTDALEPFHPDRFASRILGMGDVLGIIDKAKEALEGEDVEALERNIQKKIREHKLDLNDFLDQLQRARKMGPVSQLVEMLPGIGNVKSQLKLDQIDDSFFAKAEAVVYSMTPQERRHPEVINGSRRKRIALGSGTTPQEVNRLLNQWKEAKKIMEAVSSGRGPDLLKMMRF